MTRIYKPTILIGLDQYGKIITDEILAYAKIQDEIIYNCLLMDFSFEKECFLSAKDPDVKLRFDGSLCLERLPYKKNYELILDKEDEFIESIELLLKKIESIKGQGELILKDITTSRTQICVFASTFEKQGSSWILPVIKFLNKLGNRPEINLFLFLDDLSLDENHESKSQQKIRSHACLTELDSYFTDEPYSNLNMVYILGSRNERKRVIQGFSDLVEPIVEFVFLTAKNEVYSDQSFNHVFASAQTNSSKLNRCSSFGVCKISFSKEKTAEALLSLGKNGILSGLIEKNESRLVDANFVNTEIRKFFSEKSYFNVCDLLKKTDSGGIIFEPFQFNPQLGEDFSIPAESYLESIDSASTTYNEKTFTIFVEKLSKRKDELENKYYSDLTEQLNSYFDQDEKSYSYASAFLSALLKRDSAYINGEVLGEIENIENVTSQVRLFYTNRLGITVREKEINELDQSIKSKAALCEKRRSKLSEFENEINSLKDNPTENININEIEIKLKAEKDDLTKLTVEISEMEARYKKERGEVERLNKQVEDVNFRKSLMAGEIEKIKGEIVKFHEPIKNAQNQYVNCLKLVDDLSEKRKKTLTWLLYIGPSIFLSIFLITLVSFGLFSNKLSYIIGTSVAVLYTIFATLYYYNNVGSDYKNAKEQERSIKSTRNRQFAELQGMYKNLYEVQFSHHLNSYAFQLVFTLKEKIQKLSIKLSEFIDRLKSRQKEYLLVWDEFSKNREKIFIHSIVSKEDCVVFYERQCGMLLNFFKNTNNGKLSQYFSKYRDEPNYLALELDANMEVFLRELYSSNINSTLSELMYSDTDITKRLAPKSNLQRLFETSQPMIKLTEGQVNRTSELICSCFLDISNEGYCVNVKSDLSSLGINNMTFKKSSDPDELTFISIRVGFPICEIDSLIQSRKEVEKILYTNSTDSGDTYFIKDSYSTLSFFPEESNTDTFSHIKARDVLIARACNLISFDLNTREYIFEKNKIGKTLHDVAKFFKSVKAEDLYSKMKIEIVKISDDISSSSSSGFRGLINTYLTSDPDRISRSEKELLQQFLNDLSVL